MDIRKIILVGLAIGVSWFVYKKAVEPSYEPPPGYKAAMEHFAKEADIDWNGPKGENARIACRRIAGVSVAAKTSIDVLRAGYDEATAIKFGDCIVNHMYPVDAKKDRELSRRLGIDR